MFPLIPILAGLAVLGGVGTLYWYDTLSDDQKEEANELAAHYAKEHFETTVEQLTRDQARVVHRLTKAHFG